MTAERTLKYLLGLGLDDHAAEIHIFPMPQNQTEPHTSATLPEYQIYFYRREDNAFRYQTDILTNAALIDFVGQMAQKSISEKTLISFDLGNGQKVTVTITVTPTPFGKLLIIKINPESRE